MVRIHHLQPGLSFGSFGDLAGRIYTGGEMVDMVLFDFVLVCVVLC